MNIGPTIVLEPKEKKKRKRELVLIIVLICFMIGFTAAEFHLNQLSSVLPFVNSIFFFGLLNFNIIILVALVWLIFRNIGKLFIERRRKILGSRLKTKLVIAFLGFSIIPTLVLFVISALYINSSFDKWFSLRIQNTLQASLEITGLYYKNTEKTAMHFAEHLSNVIEKKITYFLRLEKRKLNHDQLVSELFLNKKFNAQLRERLKSFLNAERELLALDAVEIYLNSDPERVISQQVLKKNERNRVVPQMTADVLERSFRGEAVPVVQHLSAGDLMRGLFPVTIDFENEKKIIGVVVVSFYIPFVLRNKINEISSVFEDYKGTNPLKYPMKTTYLIILVMMTLVIIFVAIWIGLYMARELTIPVERLVFGAQAVGSGNLDISISGPGHDEIAVLVNSFNKMTEDLRENRARLVQAGADLERRTLQLEAVLANISTGVIVIDSQSEITTFNQSVSQLLKMSSVEALHQPYRKVLVGDLLPLVQMIDQALEALKQGRTMISETGQWNYRWSDQVKVLAAVVTSFQQDDPSHWGVVVVMDDLTHLIKNQREMAWREVARRIAHEIKNPLTPIKLSAQRLQRRLGDQQGFSGALLKECTDTIIRHTDELKEMVNEFSDFARFPEVSPAPHQLNQALGEVLTLFQQAHPEIEIRSYFDSAMPIFEFDRDQIKRVMINLFDNAVAALSDLHEVQAKKMKVSTHYNEQLKIAVIEVEDQGVGMTDDVKARVFEPYFSTKQEGTGLGLVIVKRIINDHDGFIRVRSAPHEGTQFIIELPMNRRQSLLMKS